MGREMVESLLMIRVMAVTMLAEEERVKVATVTAAAPALAAQVLVIVLLVKAMATVRALEALAVVMVEAATAGMATAAGRVAKVMEAVVWTVALDMKAPSTRSRCCRSSPRQRSSARTLRARATSTPPVSGRMSSRRKKHP